MGETGSDQNALHLVEAEFVLPTVVELGGAGRDVVGHGCRLLQRAAVLQVGRDARSPEGVIADPRGNPGRPSAAQAHYRDWG